MYRPLFPIRMLGTSLLALALAGVVTAAGVRTARAGLPPGTPLPITQFDTILELDNSPLPARPADSAIAAGPMHLVCAGNRILKVFTLAGDLRSTIALGDLFGLPPESVHSPRLLFDAAASRFILVAVATSTASSPPTSSCLVAVSRSSNPTMPTPANPKDNWHRYQYPAARGTGAGIQVADYPSVGHDERGIYLSVNMHGRGPAGELGPFAGNRVVILDKARALNGNLPTGVDLNGALPEGVRLLDDVPRLISPNTADGPAHTLKPVEAVVTSELPAVLRESALLLGLGGTAGSPALVLYGIANPLGNPTVENLVFVPTKWSFESIESAPQPPLRTANGFAPVPRIAIGDARLQKTVFRAGNIWTGHTVEHFNLAAVRFYRLDLAKLDPTKVSLTRVQSQPSLLAEREEINNACVHFYQPAIMPDAQGNAIAVFHGSSDGTSDTGDGRLRIFPSVFYARYSGEKQSFELDLQNHPQMQRFKGTLPYDGGVWGGYTDAALDVMSGGNSVWIQGELPDPTGADLEGLTDLWMLHAGKLSSSIQIELLVNQTAATNDDMVMLHDPVCKTRATIPCQAQVRGEPGGNVVVVLTNPGSKLRFPNPADTSLTLTLPASGAAVDFSISGERPSQLMGDAVIEARLGTASGSLGGSRPVSVFSFTPARIGITSGGAYGYVGTRLTSLAGPAVRYESEARLIPPGLDCTAPQLQDVRIGISQAGLSYEASAIATNPVFTGTPTGTSARVPTTVRCTVRLPSPANDSAPAVAPLYDRPGTPDTIDANSLRPPVGCPGGGIATSRDTPSIPGTCSLEVRNAMGAVLGTAVYTRPVEGSLNAYFRTWCVSYDTRAMRPPGTPRVQPWRERRWNITVQARFGAPARTPQRANPASQDRLPEQCPLESPPFVNDLINLPANRATAPVGAATTLIIAP